MLDSALQSRPLPQFRYLWFLMLSFAMIISISNWYDARLIAIFGMVLSPGSLSFPLSFILSDTITEVYGYKNARVAIWAALFFNVLFLLFGQLVIHLPNPSFATDNEAFNKILTMNLWIVCASFVSYLISEPFNSYLIAKLKIAMRGKYMGIRFVTSTVIAAFIDSILFISIAYHGSVDIYNIFVMILNIWMIKSAIEILCLPVSIRITKKIKQKEQVDIYDYKTKFNIFSVDSTYDSSNNNYFINKVAQ
jgi:queuosine precursor transporter